MSPGAEQSVSETAITKQAQLLLMASRILKLRNLRRQVFPDAMFSEVAWDLLLLLYTHGDKHGLRPGALAELSGAPLTTALRWIDYLDAHQLAARAPGHEDPREARVSLTETAKEKLESYLSQALIRD